VVCDKNTRVLINPGQKDWCEPDFFVPILKCAKQGDKFSEEINFLLLHDVFAC
jgi:hypothetical protein